MKKTYSNPKMEVIKLNAQQMILSGSSVGFGSGTQNAGNSLGREDEGDEW